MLFIKREDIDAISGRDQAIPISGATSGTLAFPRGASNVVIRSTSERDHLCRLSFTGRVPEVRTDGKGRIDIVYPRVFHPLDWRKHGVNATLVDGLPWTLHVATGLAHLDADLTSLRIDAITVDGGASDLRIALPAPSGIVPIHIRGGASGIELVRPADVPVRVEIAGGVSDLRLDDQRIGAMGGPIVLHTGSVTTTPDRYEVSIGGGASRITVREATATG